MRRRRRPALYVVQVVFHHSYYGKAVRESIPAPRTYAKPLFNWWKKQANVSVKLVPVRGV